jgi:chromosome segregation ATPase
MSKARRGTKANPFRVGERVRHTGNLCRGEGEVTKVLPMLDGSAKQAVYLVRFASGDVMPQFSRVLESIEPKTKTEDIQQEITERVSEMGEKSESVGMVDELNTELAAANALLDMLRKGLVQATERADDQLFTTMSYLSCLIDNRDLHRGKCHKLEENVSDLKAENKRLEEELARQGTMLRDTRVSLDAEMAASAQLGAELEETRLELAATSAKLSGVQAMNDQLQRKATCDLVESNETASRGFDRIEELKAERDEIKRKWDLATGGDARGKSELRAEISRLKQVIDQMAANTQEDERERHELRLKLMVATAQGRDCRAQNNELLDVLLHNHSVEIDRLKAEIDEARDIVLTATGRPSDQRGIQQMLGLLIENRDGYKAEVERLRSHRCKLRVENKRLKRTIDDINSADVENLKAERDELKANVADLKANAEKLDVLAEEAFAREEQAGHDRDETQKELDSIREEISGYFCERVHYGRRVCDRDDCDDCPEGGHMSNIQMLRRLLDRGRKQIFEFVEKADSRRDDLEKIRAILVNASGQGALTDMTTVELADKVAGGLLELIPKLGAANIAVSGLEAENKRLKRDLEYAKSEVRVQIGDKDGTKRLLSDARSELKSIRGRLADALCRVGCGGSSAMALLEDLVGELNHLKAEIEGVKAINRSYELERETLMKRVSAAILAVETV